MNTPTNDVIVRKAATNALLTAGYIAAIALFLSNTANLFGKVQEPNALIPMLMLSLFVFSAAITGYLVFGEPILWYLDGKRAEAQSLLAYMMLIFFIIILLVIAALLMLSS